MTYTRGNIKSRHFQRAGVRPEGKILSKLRTVPSSLLEVSFDPEVMGRYQKQ